MEKITVSISNINRNNKGGNKKASQKDKEKIMLTYHPFKEEILERFTYLVNGIEQEFTDNSYIVNKVSANKSIAKKTYVEKVMLKFHEAKDHVEYQEGYFAFKGTDKKFLDDVYFDEEKNSYIGIITNVNTYDKEVKLFEEN